MTTLNGSYREFTLDNGLHIMLQNTPTQTIAGRLRVNFGSYNEKPGEEGLAHFLEHCLMTGGSEKYSPEQAEKILGAFGSFNAGTGINKTIFPVDMLSEDLDLYLDFVADIAFNPTLDPIKFEEERQRVLREIATTKSAPEYKDNEAFRHAFFGKNSPQTHSNLGKEEVVQSATPKTLKEFHKRGYGASNMDLILVGDLPKNVEELIGNHFSDKPKGQDTSIDFPRDPKLTKSVILHTHAPELFNYDQPQESNALVSINMSAPHDLAQDRHDVIVMNYIFGGDSSSRLFQTLSQRKGLTYGINSSYVQCNNSGYINIGGSIPSSRVDEAIDLIFDEMNKLQDTPVAPEEIERIRRTSLYDVAKTFETNNGHVLAIEIRKDKGFTPENHAANMNAVTPESVQKAAQNYLQSDRENGLYAILIRDPLKQE